VSMGYCFLMFLLNVGKH